MTKLHTCPFSPFYKGEGATPVEDAQQGQGTFNLNQLLALEETDEYLRAPDQDSVQFLAIVIEALDQQRVLHSVQTQISKRVSSDMHACIENEVEAYKAEVQEMQLTLKQCARLAQANALDTGLRTHTWFSADGRSSSRRGRRRSVTTNYSNADDDRELASRLRLAELMRRVLSLCLRVVRNHLHVHGILSARRAQTDKGPEGGLSLQQIWSQVEIEVLVLVGTFLEAPPLSLVEGKRRGVPEDAQALTFTFADSNSPSIVDLCKGKGKRKGKSRTPQIKSKASWIEHSAYHITVIHRPLCAFIEQAQNIMGQHKDDQHSSLTEFMSVFVTDTFLVRVTADTTRAMQAILSDPAALQPRELRTTEAGCETRSGRLLLKAALEVEDVLRRLFTSMLVLREAVPEFLGIAQEVLTRFLDFCDEQYLALTKGLAAAAEMTDTKVQHAMAQDPFYQALREGLSGSALESVSGGTFFSHERPPYGGLFQQSPAREKLMWDFPAWSTLALIAESTEWLCEMVMDMANPAVKGGGRRRSAVGSKSEHGGWDRGARVRGGATGKNVVDGQIRSTRILLAEQCQQLADRVLLTLRLELQCRFFFFLQQVQVGVYWCSTESTRPEPFILSLNKELSSIDQTLARVLPDNKMRYLFGGTAELSAKIFIHSLGCLQDQRVNKKGLNKLRRNVFAVHQGVMELHGGQDGSRWFDHVRQFLELLNVSEKQLAQFESTKGHVFTAQEYLVLRQIKTEKRSTPLRKGV